MQMSARAEAVRSLPRTPRTPGRDDGGRLPMRYMYLVIPAEESADAAPPQAMMDAMQKLIAERAADGSLIDTGGLLPTGLGAARVTLKQGKLSVTDGPFPESKEVIGGYASSNSPRAKRRSHRRSNSWSCTAATCQAGTGCAKCARWRLLTIQPAAATRKRLKPSATLGSAAAKFG